MGKSPIERDRNMAEVGEVSDIACDVLGRLAQVTFLAASEQWERNQNEKRLRIKISESVSTPGDWNSRVEHIIMQQAREVAQLH
jgi:hypothetical protein